MEFNFLKFDLLIFVSSSFNFDFHMHKTHVKAFFSKFCLLEIIVRPLISSMTKLELYNDFSF